MITVVFHKPKENKSVRYLIQAEKSIFIFMFSVSFAFRMVYQ